VNVFSQEDQTVGVNTPLSIIYKLQCLHPSSEFHKGEWFIQRENLYPIGDNTGVLIRP